MKIGIMTFWWSQDNYGQLLQCYALQKYLRDMGHDAYLIRYNPENDTNKTSLIRKFAKIFNPKKLTKYIFMKIKRKITEKKRFAQLEELRLNPRYFDDFRAKYLKCSDTYYSSYDSLNENPPEADVYIVGADQVWNFNLYPKKAINAYFLNFGKNEIKRLSYAASWSIPKIDKKHITQISPLLQKFNYVSVREIKGLFYCEKCGVKNAEWVPDPTFLLKADKDRQIYKESTIRKPKDSYVLLYMLGNSTDFNIQKAYDFAKSKNLKIIYVTGNGVVDDKEKYYATIPEWLYLIDNAEYVITNSFHCCVFSSLFNKKFGVIQLSGVWKGSNDRFESLFKFLGIDSRYITNANFDNLEISYQIKDLCFSQSFLEALYDSKN